jgi:hypothetical protein
MTRQNKGCAQKIVLSPFWAQPSLPIQDRNRPKASPTCPESELEALLGNPGGFLPPTT